jgi:hypothetical protein
MHFVHDHEVGVIYAVHIVLDIPTCAQRLTLTLIPLTSN